MTTFNDVFGSDTVPPSEYGFSSYVITTNTVLQWPYNTNDSTTSIAKIMDFSCQSGNSVTLPDARNVSTGEDFLIKNVGANSLTVKDNSGVTIANVGVGTAVLFYLKDNTTAPGVFGVIQYGVGTSFVDAATLVGYGIKAISGSLNQSHIVQLVSGNTTITATHRASVVVNNGGAVTLALDNTVTLGNDFFVIIRNDGSGTLTLDPYSSQLVDGQISFGVQPGESLMLFCSGLAWYSVGYGRSTLYQFTQLIKDVSSGGTFTLSATEASNKLLTFIGNPSTAITVVVPSVVSVYYAQSSLSTAQTITIKTALGTGVALPQGARIIALCDGTNVVSAQSVQSNTTVSLVDGGNTLPSLNFASQTNTGIYKYSTSGIGFAVTGNVAFAMEATGLTNFIPFNYLDMNTASVANSAARLKWNDQDGTLDIGMKGGNVIQQVGEELYFYVQNNSGVTVNEGQLVMVTGTVGASGRLLGAKASGLTATTGISALGVATENISSGTAGFVTAFGLVRNIDTSGTPYSQTWADGDKLYYNPSVAGGLSNISPTIPNAYVLIGWVVKAASGTGRSGRAHV